MVDIIDANQQAVPDTLPVVEGRRTLIIGLGSTGAKVANQLLEKLTWTYNSPNNVPWVRCVVLETQKAPASHPINTNARFIHLTIKQSDYAALIANPENYNANLDFSSWNIPGLTAGADSITDGANNTRILGRLSLLFPPNFTLLQNAITTELNVLANINPDQATARFNMATGQDVTVQLARELYVYVVGTLCGGTASGCFIDLGYMLQSLPGYSLNTTGIFLLPSATHGDNIQLGNTYAALVELNHYSSSRTRYRAQFPNQPGMPYEAASWGTRPYRNLYLAQGRGAADESYAKLITASADYIYTDVIGSNAGVRDGDRTNITNFFIQRDFWGATQTYFTLGLSSIEFPYTKVAKACCLRLARIGFEQMAGGEPLIEVQRNQIMKQVPLIDPEAMMDRLLTRNGANLSQSIGQALESAKPEMLQSDQAIALIKEQLDGAFEGTETPQMALPSRIVPQTIEDNARQAGLDLQAAIIKTGHDLIVGDAPKGLQMLTSYLKIVEETLTSNIESAGSASSTIVAEMRGSATDAMDRVRACRNDALLGLLFVKSSAIRRYVDEFIQISTDLYDQWARYECASVYCSLYREALLMVQKFRTRLENSGCGLLTEVRTVVDKMAALYKVTDVKSGTTNTGWSRSINGVELFEPGRTVELEYNRCMAATRTKRNLTGDDKIAEIKLALETAQPYIKAATVALFADYNTLGRFDPEPGKKVPNFDEGQIVEMAIPALGVFEPLKTRTIIDRLMSHPNRQTYLTSAGEDAGVFLDWQEGHPRYYQHTRKAYGYVFYNDRDAQAAQLQQALTQLNLLGGLNNIRAMSMADPHQILFLNERGAFSLGTIASLKDELPSSWRATYQNPPGLPSLHARGDIDSSEWVNWARADDEDRRRVRIVFLAAIATGIIQSNSVTQYEFGYKPKSSSDSGRVYFTNDIDEAALVIRKRAILADIELKIKEFRDEHGDTEVVKRLDEFIQGSNGRFMESGQVLEKEDIDAYALDYIFKDANLKDIYTTAFYPDQVVVSCRKPDLNDNGTEAYFCPKCNRRLGSTTDTLYVDEVQNGIRQRVRKCSYFDCRHRF